MSLEIKDIRPEEFKSIFKHIKQDFAPGEYPPYEVLYSQIRTGVQKGVLLLDNGEAVAYALCTEGNQYNYALLSFFAVFREFRGKGYGTSFLKEIIRYYSQKKGVIVEVEKPENAHTPEEKAMQTNRIEFYQKLGFVIVPDIEYSIWDVPMHLMVCPQQESKEAVFSQIGEIMYDIYLKLMGKRYIHKMQFKKR